MNILEISLNEMCSLEIRFRILWDTKYFHCFLLDGENHSIASARSEILSEALNITMSRHWNRLIKQNSSGP